MVIGNASSASSPQTCSIMMTAGSVSASVVSTPCGTSPCFAPPGKLTKVRISPARKGQREEGVFFAANIFVQKCVSGLGVLATAALLNFADFPTHAIPGTVAPETLTRLGKSYVAAIVVLNLASVACVWMFRITRASDAMNLAILAERRGRHITPPRAQ